MERLYKIIAKKIKDAELKKNPVDHLIIEDFLPIEVANNLSSEFPSWDSESWHVYKNAIEDKKTCNQWNLFDKFTYKFFTDINSALVVDAISSKFGIDLMPDQGLHGGGQHFHSKSGNLNPHLDYSIHPKLGLERRINIIYYLTDNYEVEDGGHFGLWGNASSESPGELIVEIPPIFNSAVIFNTSQNSWHGMSRMYNPKTLKYRKSLASYYISEPRSNALKNTRAKFAARENQKSDKSVLKQIATRVSESEHEKAYVWDENKNQS